MRFLSRSVKKQQGRFVNCTLLSLAFTGSMPRLTHDLCVFCEGGWASAGGGHMSVLQGTRRTTRTLHVSLSLVPLYAVNIKWYVWYRSVAHTQYSKYFSSLDRKWFLDKLKPEGKII